MKQFAVLTFGLAALVATAACGQPAGTLAAAADALKASETKSIEYSGTGKWFQFGQAASATLPWPAVRRHRLQRLDQLRGSGRAHPDDAQADRRPGARTTDAG